MCNGDLNADKVVAEWDSTCQQIEEWANLGVLECNSTDMEFARSECCTNYFAPECN